ncbi:uncharacterized protein ACO6RY_17322 [Pungitius sinensis]
MGDVCAELRRSGGSGPDCRNPEVVVAITGRVLHNAPGCSKSRGEQGGGQKVGGAPPRPRRSEPMSSRDRGCRSQKDARSRCAETLPDSASTHRSSGPSVPHRYSVITL